MAKKTQGKKKRKRRSQLTDLLLGLLCSANWLSLSAQEKTLRKPFLGHASKTISIWFLSSFSHKTLSLSSLIPCSSHSNPSFFFRSKRKMQSSMDLLRSNLSRVRIPEPTNRIYKQECCISFHTPVTSLRPIYFTYFSKKISWFLFSSIESFVGVWLFAEIWRWVVRRFVHVSCFWEGLCELELREDWESSLFAYKAEKKIGSRRPTAQETDPFGDRYFRTCFKFNLFLCYFKVIWIG